MDLIQFKDVFGAPGTGIHSYRVFNIAIVDVLGTFALAALIKKAKPNWQFSRISIGLFVSAVIIHRIFGVNTTINKTIFGQV